MYFVQSEIGGPFKIGTTTNVDFRLRRMQACCPFPLRVLHVVPGGPSLERELHNTFAPFRLHGEWSDNSREVMGYIARPRLKSRVNGRNRKPVGVKSGVGGV